MANIITTFSTSAIREARKTKAIKRQSCRIITNQKVYWDRLKRSNMKNFLSEALTKTSCSPFLTLSKGKYAKRLSKCWMRQLCKMITISIWLIGRATMFWLLGLGLVFIFGAPALPKLPSYTTLDLKTPSPAFLGATLANSLRSELRVAFSKTGMSINRK